MKHLNTTQKRSDFTPLLSTASVQAAMMTLPPGESSSDKIEDEHPKAEQWIFILSGTGRAKTRTRSTPISPGSLLLIEKNEPHQITATGTTPLVSLNFYAPPAYTKAGEVRKAVKNR